MSRSYRKPYERNFRSQTKWKTISYKSFRASNNNILRTYVDEDELLFDTEDLKRNLWCAPIDKNRKPYEVRNFKHSTLNNPYAYISKQIGYYMFVDGEHIYTTSNRTDAEYYEIHSINKQKHYKFLTKLSRK